MGDCHFLEGNLRAKERVEYAKMLLEEVGLGEKRLEMYHMGASDAPVWVEKVVEFTERIRAMGPNPLKRNDLPPSGGNILGGRIPAEAGEEQ